MYLYFHKKCLKLNDSLFSETRINLLSRFEDKCKICQIDVFQRLHPYKQKIIPKNNFIHKVISIPISENSFLNELNEIKQIAGIFKKSNGTFNVKII